VLSHAVQSASTDRQASRAAVARIAVVAMVICGVTIGAWNVLRQHIPVSGKRMAPQNGGNSSYSPRHTVPSVAAVSNIDSLTLGATTNDSVWVKIGRDALEPQQYFLPPHAKTFWRAEQMFWVTIGNAGGIEFTLNKRRLGVFGKRRTIVRDLLFTRQQLDDE
jgi:hypothetical protein